ncbi:MAG TPA: hypothetical protein VGX96_11670 [Candidatus Elarobacter sp.]|jgi:hypothetical protein|nr:hypothetical protein [Candidatus Elarobacter sp.]
MLNASSGALFPAVALAIAVVATQCVSAALATHSRIDDIVAAIWSVF